MLNNSQVTRHKLTIPIHPTTALAQPVIIPITCNPGPDVETVESLLSQFDTICLAVLCWVMTAIKRITTVTTNVNSSELYRLSDTQKGKSRRKKVFHLISKHILKCIQ